MAYFGLALFKIIMMYFAKNVMTSLPLSLCVGGDTFHSTCPRGRLGGYQIRLVGTEASLLSSLSIPGDVRKKRTGCPLRVFPRIYRDADELLPRSGVRE